MERHSAAGFEAGEADADVLPHRLVLLTYTTDPIERAGRHPTDYNRLHRRDIAKLYLRYIQSAEYMRPPVVISALECT